MGRADYNPLSLWQKVEMPRFSPLGENLSPEVCVVGAGIAGLMTAYQLQEEGFEVVVIDKDELGNGETGLTSAHLASALDDGFETLIREHGEKGARLAFDSHAAAIDEIERISRAESIPCDFRRLTGYLVPHKPEAEEEIRREWEACQRLELPGVKKLEGAPSVSQNSWVSLAFENQAEFHPLKFLAGLASAFVRRGGRIFTHTAAHEIIGGEQPAVQTSTGHRLVCRSVVLATGVPVQGRVAIHTKEAAYRSYVVTFEIAPSSMERMLLWDTEDPYHYVRIYADEGRGRDYLIVGGEDHRTGQDSLPDKHYQALETWTRSRFPEAGAVVSRWSGQIIEPMDSLAYIGRHPSLGDNVFMISGDSGHGLTHGVLGALILRDLISGRPNDWAEVYDPSRKNWKGFGSFVSENVNTAAQYADWLSLGDVGSADEILPGEGAILRSGFQRHAVYRDVEGGLHTLSAVCPHLGGVVRWNSAEKSWDCPCHGSRFDCHGNVLNGPSREGLKLIEEENQRLPEGEPLAEEPGFRTETENRDYR